MTALLSAGGHAAVLTSVPSAVCPVISLVVPGCAAAGALGSTVFSGAAGAVVGTGIGAVFGGVTQWVVQGAGFLLDQVGSVLSATTTVDLGATWFSTHYQAMTALLGVVLLPMLLLAAMQALYRQNPALLLRPVLVHLPMALLLTGVAVTMVRLVLSATDALSSAVAAGSGVDIGSVLSGLSSSLSRASAVPGAPAFVLLLGALLVALGAFTLWIELLVRAAAVYVAVLFLPLALGSLVWPAISHWCRRLVDTLAALILAKFVIVAVLSLAVSALASGGSGGVASVLGGGALLLLASFTPFTLLRLLPLVEAGAAHQLEGARHRVQHAATAPVRPAASLAMRQLRAESFPSLDPGSGMEDTFEPAGTWLRDEFEAARAAGGGDGSGEGAGGGSGGPLPGDGAEASGGETGEGTAGAGAGDPDEARWQAWADYFCADEEKLRVPGVPPAVGIPVPPVNYLKALERDPDEPPPPPYERGRPPVFGGSWFDDFDLDPPRERRSDRGDHAIGTDGDGPVIRWRPGPGGDAAGGSPGGPPALPPGAEGGGGG